MAIIAIDFDDTTHNSKNPKPGMKMGPPMDGAVESIQALKAAGNIIIIHTVRDRFQPVMEWLDYYKIPYDDVTNIKPNAKWFIDDKAIEFRGNWEEVLRKVYGS